MLFKIAEKFIGNGNFNLPTDSFREKFFKDVVCYIYSKKVCYGSNDCLAPKGHAFRSREEDNIGIKPISKRIHASRGEGGTTDSTEGLDRLNDNIKYC
jgi:hypothetical protein